MSEPLFGAYLRRRREELGKKLKDVANEVDISIVYLSDIELGRRPPPSAEKLSRLATALAVEVEQLRELIDRDENKVALDFGSGNLQQARAEVGIKLARKWGQLSQEELNKISKIIKDPREQK